MTEKEKKIDLEMSHSEKMKERKIERKKHNTGDGEDFVEER
jgi:hypothetical protein